MLDGRCCIFSSIISKQFYYFSSRLYFGFQIDEMFGYTSDGQLVLEANLNKFCQLKQISLNRYVDPKSDAIAFCVKTCPSGLFIKNRSNMHEMQNRLYTEYDAIYVSKLRAKMHQNTCVDFKLGYADAKSDAIAFCVKT